MTEERKEIVEILLANRLYLYSLLHKCFGREPDRAQLELLASEQTAEGFAILGGEVLEKVPAFFAELREDLKDPSFPEQVKAEYNRFFIGPGDLTAPPWESIYLGNEGALFQKTTLEVRQAYRAFGLQPESFRRVPDDSLALELAFLSTLAERALQAFRHGDEAAMRRNLEGSKDFLDRHLLRWIPMYLERMAQSPSDLLYPQLSLILGSFLKKDADFLSELLKEDLSGAPQE